MHLSPRLSLLVGFLWYSIWGYDIYLAVESGKFLEGFIDFLVLFPLGISFFYDSILKRKTGRGFLEAPLWNIGDWAYFSSGFNGLIAILLAFILKMESEFVLMGSIMFVIALMHYVRRRLRVVGHL